MKSSLNRIVMDKILIICALLLIIVDANFTCYNYDNGDIYPYKNISYCTSVIQWPVSDQTFLDYTMRDKWALGNYTILKKNYYDQGLVNLNCLGISQYFFCAMAYPTCTTEQSQITGMCSWLCNLWAIRCGTNDEFYTMACKSGGNSGSSCTYQKHLLFGLMLIVSILVMIL